MSYYQSLPDQKQQSASLGDENIQAVIDLFNQCFQYSEQTCLVKGGEEPIYLPWHHSGEFAQVVFAHGFLASALHEVAHWCIAGKERRAQVDYGYWYEPDGRSADDQERFVAVEAKPQAVEWFFSKACGKSFNISLDNISLDHNDFKGFKKAVVQEAKFMQANGLPARAEIFRQALSIYCSAHDTPSSVAAYHFDLGQLM